MTIEKFEGPEFKKFNAAREKSAAEEAQMMREVDEYFKEIAEEKSQSYEDVRRACIKEYADIVLDSPLVAPGDPKKQLIFVKRAIHTNLVVPWKKKKAAEMQKAA